MAYRDAGTAKVRMTWPMLLRNQVEIDDRLVKVQPIYHRLLVILLLQNPHHCTPLHGLTSLIAFMWPDPDKEPEQAVNSVKSGISRLRGLGVPIENRVSFGYRIAPRNRA